MTTRKSNEWRYPELCYSRVGGPALAWREERQLRKTEIWKKKKKMQKCIPGCENSKIYPLFSVPTTTALMQAPVAFHVDHFCFFLTGLLACSLFLSSPPSFQPWQFSIKNPLVVSTICQDKVDFLNKTLHDLIFICPSNLIFCLSLLLRTPYL